ncbi:acyl carrier protein [Candidatus Dependentiae bacterium]
MAEFNRQDIQNKIIDIVSKKLSIDKEVVIKSTSFEDLGADSLDMVEIIMKLEEQFGIEISDEDAEKLSSLAQVVDYIEGLRKK